MRYVASLALVLAVLWLAVSGVYKPLILLLGAGSVALVVWISIRMDVVGVEHDPVLFSWRLPVYWAWLVGQIVMANFHVAARALSPGAKVSPRIIQVPVELESAVAKVTYANSCTLTPGTVALLLEPDRLTVHALTREAADRLSSGEMARWAAWLEGRR